MEPRNILGTLSVLVQDAQTNQPLEDSIVSVLEITQAKQTDSRGIAFFYGLPAALATVVVEHENYEKSITQTKIIPLPHSTDVKVRLNPVR